MATLPKPEVWLRGPLDGLPPLLQPVAHTLLQAEEEIEELMSDFPDELLWQTPAGLASPGFHLQHLTGVLDRLFTYAAGEMLSDEQLTYLKAEGKAEGSYTTKSLIAAFKKKVEDSISYLKNLTAEELTDKREVGRARLPSTVLGLLFHAAEHTMRHTGQLLVTVKILLAQIKHDREL
jgi:uncharacterized damage-inducible protein DinB